jgi:hypothetical protein
MTLHRNDLDAEAVNETLGAIFKYQEDVIRAKEEAVPMLLSRYAGE